VRTAPKQKIKRTWSLRRPVLFFLPMLRLGRFICQPPQGQEARSRSRLRQRPQVATKIASSQAAKIAHCPQRCGAPAPHDRRPTARRRRRPCHRRLGRGAAAADAITGTAVAPPAATSREGGCATRPWSARSPCHARPWGASVHYMCCTVADMDPPSTARRCAPADPR